MKISIVSPVYRAETLLVELVDRVAATVRKLSPDFEIILVEDGSPDNSWSIIDQLCRQHDFVKGLRLSRNFGQHYAITAGLAEAAGDWVVVMDCDLQDVPEEIANLYQKAATGYDIVFAQRTQRSDGWLKKLSSRLFYALFSYLTDTVQDATIANFGIYRRPVVRAILAMGDRVRYFPTMSQWVGYRSTKLPVTHARRPDGGSSYSLAKLLGLAFDNMVAFSDKPLRLATRLGFTISFLSLVVGLVYLGKYLRGEILVMGFASIMLSIWFLSGLIILILGVIGQYLAKVFAQVKNRPYYLVAERVNC